ncbi:MAG: PQQ-binding-like beta-propeller repeat protein [Melioribacteraceae bacterium]|nr:PQQ-binding-like beta-propeller repeat protein [Melioribacteraceae bacterium]
MKKNFTLFILLGVASVFLFYRCDKSVDPIIDNDVVPQQDIVWESLADSPWPMFHHDPQSTGRSKYRGPQSGIIYKKAIIGYSESGIVLDKGEKLYTTSTMPAKLLALDYDGNERWNKDYFISYTTPLIGKDNIVYSPGVDHSYAFSSNGDTIWHRVNSKNDERIMNVGFSIDKNGNLYYVELGGTLIVVDKNGETKWRLKDDRILPYRDGCPSFSPDGNTLYLQGKSVSLLAIDINERKIKWTFGTTNQLSSPVIDNAGNIYINPGDIGTANRTLYSITPKGDIRWEFSYKSNMQLDNTEPTIDYNGNLYFGSDTLYSITNSGNLRWKKYLDSTNVVSPIICDNENTIYVGTEHGYKYINKIYAFKENGDKKWEIIDTEERAWGVSPAISEVGILFYPTFDNSNKTLLIIR